MHLEGELDLLGAPAVADTITDLLDVGFQRIVVDLRLVSFLDSTGLRTLLTSRSRAYERGVALALVRGPRPVERIFELTGTSSLFAFEDARRLR